MSKVIPFSITPFYSCVVHVGSLFYKIAIPSIHGCVCTTYRIVSANSQCDERDIEINSTCEHLSKTEKITCSGKNRHKNNVMLYFFMGSHHFATAFVLFKWIASSLKIFYQRSNYFKIVHCTCMQTLYCKVSKCSTEMHQTMEIRSYRLVKMILLMQKK